MDSSSIKKWCRKIILELERDDDKWKQVYRDLPSLEYKLSRAIYSFVEQIAKNRQRHSRKKLTATASSQHTFGKRSPPMKKQNPTLPFPGSPHGSPKKSSLIKDPVPQRIQPLIKSTNSSQDELD